MNLSSLKIAASLIAAIGLSGGAAYQTGVIDKPSAGLVDKGDWVTENGIQVESTAYVHNPNPLGLNLSGFSADYTLKMNDVALAEGEKEGLEIPKDTNRTLNFTSDLQTSNIPLWWSRHLSNGEESELQIPVTASLKLGPLPLSGTYTHTDSISTDIEGSLTSSLSKMEGNYSRDMATGIDMDATSLDLEIIDASARFGEVSKESTEVMMSLRIRNRNSYPVPTPQLGGDLDLNDVRVVQFTANDIKEADDAVIPAGEAREITVSADMSNEKIDEWFRSHIRKEEKTDAELTVYFEFEVGGASFRIPSDSGMNCRFDFATKILEDQKAETDGFQGCSGIVRADSGGAEQDSEDEEGILEPDNDDEGSNQTENDSEESLGGIL